MDDLKKLQENYKYPDPRFPFNMSVAAKGGISPHRSGFGQLHWHEELQFSLVTRGTVSMQVNGLLYPMSAGEGIFINRGLLHTLAHISEDGMYISFNFSDKILSFFSGSRMEQDWVLPYVGSFYLPAILLSPKIPWQKNILKSILHIADISENETLPKKEYLICVELTRLWYDFITHLDEANISHIPKGQIDRQQRVQTILAYIHQHYSENIFLKDLASAASISISECCRCFQATLHTTPKNYLCDYRISKSLEMLDRQSLSITHIAAASGFHSDSHYISCFKKKMGMTPSKYRKYAL